MDIAVLLTFGLVFATAELALGTLIGWWLRGKREVTQKTADAQASGEQTAKAKKALENLHRLAASVATNVGDHNTKVQQINTELSTAAASGDAEGAVLASLTKLMAANEKLQSDLRSAENKLHEQGHELEARTADALTDPLTGRANRRAFDNELERRIIEWNRRQTPVTLMMVDVDHFKKFNDTHGHQAGDEVLKKVAKTLFKSMRDMDLVARYGGEEFGVVMPVTTVEQATVAVERARKAIEDFAVEHEGKTLKVTISCGVTQSQTGDNPAALIKRADDALYAAKKAGRNRAFQHTGEETLPLTGKVEAKLPEVKTEVAPEVKPTQRKTETVIVHDLSASGELDPQSGIPSRAVFNLDLRRRLAEAKRYASPLSTMVVAVDHFEEFGDTHGEPMKNLVLRTVATFLSAAIREMDSVARFDEDSFVIMLPGTTIAAAGSIADRLRQSISMHALKSPTGNLKLTVSVGVAEVETSDDADTLSQRSRDAADSAKMTGGNRVCLFRNGLCVGLQAEMAQ